MFYGIPVWMFKREPCYEDTIRKIAGLGFEGVELIAWSRAEMDEYYTPENIARLRELVRTLDMRVTNFNHTPKCITTEDAGLRNERVSDFKRAIDVAYGFGIQNVTMVAQYPFGEPYSSFTELRHITEIPQWSFPDFNPDRDWDANLSSFAETLRLLCDYARERGVRVLIEPHPYRIVNSGASMLRLIERVGADNLGMNFDPSHLFPQGDMPEWTVHMLGKYIWHTHFSDNDTLTNVHWRPGQGKINWTAVMKALSAIGYDGAINFELEDVPGAPTPSAATRNMKGEMSTELLLSRQYIDRICEPLGIRIGGFK